MAETYYSIKLSTLTDIGNAIRAKSGATGDIAVTNLATSILNLSPAGEIEEWDGVITIVKNTRPLVGSYIIDQQKAYDAILALTSTKTFPVSFGAGGPAGGGDEVNYTSMTFNAEVDWLAYDAIAAFTCVEYMNGGNGFVSYPYAGDAARINFPEGTEVSPEFYDLFLSIADEYDTSIITFTIEGAEYQAKRDMTWQQWVNSEYYKDGFVISGNYFEYNTYKIVNSTDISQKATDIIVEGMAYGISWGQTN